MSGFFGDPKNRRGQPIGRYGWRKRIARAVDHYITVEPDDGNRTRYVAVRTAIALGHIKLTCLVKPDATVLRKIPLSNLMAQNLIEQGLSHATIRTLTGLAHTSIDSALFTVNEAVEVHTLTHAMRRLRELGIFGVSLSTNARVRYPRVPRHILEKAGMVFGAPAQQR